MPRTVTEEYRGWNAFIVCTCGIEIRTTDDVERRFSFEPSIGLLTCKACGGNNIGGAEEIERERQRLKRQRQRDADAANLALTMDADLDGRGW